MGSPILPPSPNPQELLRNRAYVKLLALATIVGVPVSGAAYGFLKVVAALQEAFFERLPKDLGLDPC